MVGTGKNLGCFSEVTDKWGAPSSSDPAHLYVRELGVLRNAKVRFHASRAADSS
jgi:hypothetical protein